MRRWLYGALLFGAAGAPLAAQDASAPMRDSIIPDSRLFHRGDAWLLVGFSAAAITLFQYDTRLATWFQSERFDTPGLRRLEQTLDFTGGIGTIAIGGALYVVGRVADKPRVAHLALHTTEAIFVGLGSAGVIKGVLGRARPYVTADSNARDFGFLRGFKGSPWQSFPSGHTTASFAVAAAVTSETSEWWPRSRWIIGPLLFGGASVVGLSRMYDDKHWASDVVMGAAIGTFAGLKTVRFNHTRTGNRIDRWLLGDAIPHVTPAPDGALSIGVGVRW